MKNKLIPQKESMGCAVAYVASLLGINYKKILKIIQNKKADKPNFYFKDIVKILSKKRLNYSYGKAIPRTKKYISGTMVFVKRSKKFPFGHYLLRTREGWMNPWINLPKTPIKAGFQKRIPGKAKWIIYSNSNL